MSAQHTPGPLIAAWGAIREARGWLNTERPEGKTNALVALNAVQDDPGLPAALLAEAAPDLLAALRMFVACVEQPETSTWEAYKAGRAALDKATGAAPKPWL